MQQLLISSFYDTDHSIDNYERKKLVRERKFSTTIFTVHVKFISKTELVRITSHKYEKELFSIPLEEIIEEINIQAGLDETRNIGDPIVLIMRFHVRSVDPIHNV